MRIFDFCFGVVCVLLAQATLFSIERAPWLGNVYEFEAKASASYSKSRKIDTLHGKKQKGLHADLLALGLQYTATPDFDLQIELDSARTTKHSFHYDGTRLQARALLSDDVRGDLVSLTFGAEAGFFERHFLRDFSIIRHSTMEALFHAALGKEFGFFDETRFFRAHALLLQGIGRHASSWTRGEVHVSFLADNVHRVDLFGTSEQAHGAKRLHSLENFPGYAHLAYRFTDVGILYEYALTAFGKAYVRLEQRVHGRYCPSDTFTCLAGLDIPFSF